MHKNNKKIEVGEEYSSIADEDEVVQHNAAVVPMEHKDELKILKTRTI